MFLIKLKNNFFITTLEVQQTNDYNKKTITFKDHEYKPILLNNDYANSSLLLNNYNFDSLFTLVFFFEDIEIETGKNLYFGLFDKNSYDFNKNDKLTHSVYLSEEKESWFLDIFYKLENGTRNKKNDKDIIYRNFGIPPQVKNLNFLKAIQKKDVISFDGKLSEKNGVLTFTVEKTNIGQKEMRNRQLSNKKFDINLMLLKKNQLNNLNNFINYLNGYNMDLSDNAFVFLHA